MDNVKHSVKQSLWLLLFISALVTADTLEQSKQIYLEGITLLGAYKTAHITVDEAKMSVQEGDELGEWTVYEIHQRTVVLQNELGEEKVLELHSRVDVTLPSEPSEPSEPSSQDEILQRFPDANPFAGRPRIDDADVPEGMRKVVTPFGDFLVEIVDEQAEKNRLLQKAEQNVLSAFENANNADDSEQTDSSDSKVQIIRTPFGDLTVNMGQ